MAPTTPQRRGKIESRGRLSFWDLFPPHKKFNLSNDVLTFYVSIKKRN